MSTIPLEDLQVEFGPNIVGAGTAYPLSNIGGFGTTPLRSREYDNPGEDGRQFGVEYREGRDLVFEGGVSVPGDPAGAWNLSGELEAWFDAPELRDNPRAVTEVRLRRPGASTKVVYGRPDRYDPDVKKSVIGFIPWSAIFRCSDITYYDDIENVVELGLTSQSNGGLVTDEDGNIPSPITTIAGDRRTSLINNDGDKDTWPVIELHGPLLNGYIELQGPNGEFWHLGHDGSLAYDQVAVIDTRPWNRQAALDSGAPLPGGLDRRSRPSLATLPPGQSELTVGGTDSTGTSSITVRWRHAYRKH